MTYHFLVDGEGQVDEMGLGAVVLTVGVQAGQHRPQHVDCTLVGHRLVCNQLHKEIANIYTLHTMIQGDHGPQTATEVGGECIHVTHHEAR